MIKQIFSAVKIIALALVLSFGFSYVYAWTAPTQQPPSGNVGAPINTSATAQTKTGALNVGGLTSTQDINIGANKLVTNGSNSNYSSMTVQGGKNGWTGINFKQANGSNAGTLMMHSRYSGFYNAADNGWSTYTAETGVAGQLGNTYANDYYSYAAGKWMSEIAGAGGGIGVGQTWVDVTSSRAINTVYTNSTSKPIMVSVSGLWSPYVYNHWGSQLYVGGVLVAKSVGYYSGSNEYEYSQLSAIVPPGATYEVTGNGFSDWVELR